MRSVVLLTVFVIAGCSSSPTLHELEEHALHSGDWSAVEERENALARRNGSQEEKCPSGYSKVCREFGMKSECRCIIRSPGVTLISRD